MDKKWAVLCSAAVAAIYATGYYSTSGQAAAIGQPDQASVQVDASVHTNHHYHNHKSGKQPQSKTSSPSKSVNQTQSQYKNGTYQGLGMNRRGQIGVTLTIKQGKIADVKISDFEMHYSESDVVGLPKEVVQKQSDQVDNVSGATYSTEAFQSAVQDALLKAENA